LFLRPRGYLTNPFKTLSLCFGVTDKTPGLISRNNFTKKILSASVMAIMSWQDVTRSSLSSDVKEYGTKCAHNFLFPKSYFRMEELESWGISKILLSFLMRFDGHFLPISATAAMFNSVRVDFGRPPLSSSSTSSLPS